MFVPDRKEDGNGVTRAARKFQIMTLLLEEGRGVPNGAWLTSHEIARKINLAPSQHLRQMLYELVAQGALHMKTDTMTNGRMRCKFTLAEETFHIKEWRDLWVLWQPQIQMTLEAVR